MKKNKKVTGLTEALRKGVVTIVFDKINDGGRRVMESTLNSELSGGKVPETLDQREESDNFVVWCIDKNDWRSFRASTLVEWYEGSPEETV